MIDLGGHSSILKAGGRSPDVDLSLGGNLDEMAKKNENGVLREALHKNIARGQSVDTITGVTLLVANLANRYSLRVHIKHCAIDIIS